MKKYSLIVLMILTVALNAYTQSSGLDSLLNEVVWSDKKFTRLIDPPSSFFYMYGGLTGDQKTLYAGRELESNMHTWNGSLYLFHNKGFFAGASGSFYGEPGTASNAVIASAGFNGPVNDNRTIYLRASYNHYFYSKNDSGYENPFTNSVGGGITVRNNWIGGRLSASLLFGQDIGMNLTPAVFLRLPLWRFGLYNKLQFEPYISSFIGSEVVEFETIGGTMPGSTPMYNTDRNYGLLNTQIYLPLCVYLGNFDIELGYYLNLPNSTVDGVSYPTSGFITFSLGYLLPL